jgi:cytochrome o ubiquinol oxidase subunit 2
MLSACGAALLLGACGLSTSPIVDPKGPIALIERDLMFETFAIMLIVVVPVFIMAAWFTSWYRASNAKARYSPDWEYSVWIDALIWVVPAAIVVTLGAYVWINTHKLDPYKHIDPSVQALEVEVVAQNWKWLFIYPDKGIASVNELVFPSGVPLRLSITSDTVMNSFYIPALGSQIYAMAGMETNLNLLASEPGTFVGRNSQYSGAGFSDQHFEAIAMTQQDFDAWVEGVKQSASVLDQATYDELVKPSMGHPVTHYASYEAGLFDSIIAKYMGHASDHDVMDAN